MPQVTAIKPQKKRNWYNIFIDKRFLFSLPPDILLKENLKVGDNISRERIEKLAKENEFAVVYNNVLKFLSRRPRSRFEIEKYFERKQVGEEVQRQLEEKLVALKLIDDEAFAIWWIEQRTKFRLKSGRYIMAELKQKGIGKDLIVRLLSEKRGKKDEQTIAEEIAEKKLKKIKELPEIEKKKKLYSTLGQKGFSYETIKEIVDKILKKE